MKETSVKVAVLPVLFNSQGECKDTSSLPFLTMKSQTSRRASRQSDKTLR